MRITCCKIWVLYPDLVKLADIIKHPLLRRSRLRIVAEQLDELLRNLSVEAMIPLISVAL